MVISLGCYLKRYVKLQFIAHRDCALEENAEVATTAEMHLARKHAAETPRRICFCYFLTASFVGADCSNAVFFYYVLLRDKDSGDFFFGG